MLKTSNSILILGMIILLSACKKDVSTAPEKPAPVIVPTTPFLLNATVYPNPTTGIFTLKTNDSRPDSVTVTDLLGVVRLNQTMSGTTIIDIIGIQNGIYYVSVTPTSGSKIIRKIIVVH